jgi:nucleotide sugar dehydrogenase
MRACVVGLGKIGLPLATQFAISGIDTVGVDIDDRVVSRVNEGASPFDFEADLEPRLAEVVATGHLRATTSMTAGVAGAEFIVVVVPLVIDGSGTPDFSALDAATSAVGDSLERGSTVIFETTVPVGTTRNRLTPILAERSGLTPGRDFGVAFSPERVSSGTVFRDLRRYPKLVGGVDPEAAKSAAAFYEAALEFDERPDLPRPNGVWVMESAEAAELAKLAETVYRDVNIALANEFAAHAEKVGVDVWEVISASNSQPYSHIHRPGIAVGGHCIPVYPHLYMASDSEAALPAQARAINKRQPGRLLDRLEEAGGPLDGTTVAVLGAAYRGGVKETAFSGVFDLVAEISLRGGKALVHDPLFEDYELRAIGLQAHRIGDRCDLAIIHTDHEAYRHLLPADLPGCRAIVDGRALLDRGPWIEAGLPAVTIGMS